MLFKVNVRFRHPPKFEDLEVVQGIVCYSPCGIHHASAQGKGMWILIGRFHAESPTANCTPPNPEDGTLRCVWESNVGEGVDSAVDILVDCRSCALQTSRSSTDCLVNP